MVQAASKAALLHRSRFDIIATVLEAANDGGARKTHIMYRCNLSFRQLHSYLQFLVEIGLLEAVKEPMRTDDNSTRFETTRKGREFIKAYKNMNVLLSKAPR